VELSFADFLELIIHLRPENLATVLDVIELRHIFGLTRKSIENRLMHLEGVMMDEGDPDVKAAMKEMYAESLVLKDEIKNKSKNLLDLDEEYRKGKRDLEEAKRSL